MKPSNEQRYAATKRVTLISASTNSLLALAKIIIGYIGHSQALIADGVHSLSDLLSDALVLFAARMGGQVPDAEHPYGHQRIETIAAILLAILMFFVGMSIFYENVHHVLAGVSSNTHSIAVIITAIISIAANEGLYRYNKLIGERIHSNLLISNAYHNRSDAYTSAIVVIAAIGMLLGWHFFDAAGAIIIALLIIKMAIGIAWRSLQELIDSGVDQNTLQEFTRCILSVPGVESMHQLRTRLHGGTVFVDTHIIVNSNISVSEGHHIGEQVHLTLMKRFPKVTDVTVHVDPEDDENSRPCLHLPPRSKIIQDIQPYWQSLPGFEQRKKLTIHYLDGYIYLDLVLPQQHINMKQLKNITQQYLEITNKVNYIHQVNLFIDSSE